VEMDIGRTSQARLKPGRSDSGCVRRAGRRNDPSPGEDVTRYDLVSATGVGDHPLDESSVENVGRSFRVDRQPIE